MGLQRPTNFRDRKETASMLSDITYNTRQQQTQDRTATNVDDTKADTASVSTFSSEKPLLKGKSSSARNFFKRS